MVAVRLSSLFCNTVIDELLQTGASAATTQGSPECFSGLRTPLQLRNDPTTCMQLAVMVPSRSALD